MEWWRDGLAADGGFDLVPEGVTALELIEVVPDAVAGEVELGAESSRERVVLRRCVADEDCVPRHAAIAGGRRFPAARGRAVVLRIEPLRVPTLPGFHP